MAFIYHKYSYLGKINPEELKHHYYVQLTPNHKQLVLGTMRQDAKPATGSWLDVTAIDRDFSKRYFVQYTYHNTLVPGSLIQANKRPEGRWKEIKKSRPKFYRVSFSDPYQLNFPHPPNYTPVSLNYFVTFDNFVINKALPALKAVYPQLPVLPPGQTTIPNSIDIRFNLYYFKGTFAELKEDRTKLISFSSDLYVVYLAVQRSPNNLTLQSMTYVSLVCKSAAANGAYCFVLGILDDQNNETEYVVFENIMIKTSA